MKKMLSVILVLCLLLPCASLAESVREKIGAPSHLIQTYTSASGKSKVYVNAPVVIPEVENIPLYQAALCAIPEEAVNAALKYYNMENITPRQQDMGPTQGEESYEVFHWDEEENDYSISTLLMTWPPLNNRVEWSFLDFMTHEGENKSHAVPSEEEARKLADDLVNTVFPGHVYYSTDKYMDDIMLSYRASVVEGKGDYGYRFYYVSKIGDIPMAHVYNHADTGHDTNGAYSYATPYETLLVDVGADGIFQFIWENAFELGEMTDDDCKLLPFRKIKEILGAVAPKVAAKYEGSSSHNNIFIDRVELSYMILQDKDNPEAHTLTPVWDFFGSRTIDNEWYDDTDDSFITINAIDGTVIDRDYAR